MLHDNAFDGARSAAVEQELQVFSYIVSHDLAASMRHVAEFSRLLLDELGDDITSRQRAHADQIRAASNKSHLMMEQLLAFSRVQQKVLLPIRQDAMIVMRSVLLRLGVSQAAGARVSVEPLGEVFADADLFADALFALMDNALKFTRPGVGASVEVRSDHDQAFWRIQVHDNGIGVAPALREKAFQMFQRLNGETAYPGVGAGLAICRRIARRHGGEVRFIDSDIGAMVELSLPRTPALQ